MKRIRNVAGRSALAMAAVAVGLSGCSVLSPAIITEPYTASDGINIDLPGSPVGLRNFLVIGAEKGEPAVLVGAVVNGGTTEVQVSLQAALGETAQPTPTVVSVGPKSSVQIGPDQEFELVIPELPVEPGASTVLSAATSAGGRTDLSVPVLRPEDEYAALTPAPTTEAPTPTKGSDPENADAETSDSANAENEDADAEGTESEPTETETPS